MRPLLGTHVEVVVHAASADVGQRAIDAAFAAIAGVQQRLSAHDPDSELNRLNRQPGQRVPMSRDSLRVLALAQRLMRASGGLFDPTLGAQLAQRGVLPALPGPAAWPHGSADDWQIGPGWAQLHRPLRLVLCGIAKGFAVDRGVAALRSAGVRAGAINAGGDLRVFGDAPQPVHRREADGRIHPLGQLRDAALATSEVRPDAAWSPQQPGLVLHGAAGRAQAGVYSVIARSAWRADALTKVAALAAPHERAALVARLGGIWLDPAQLPRAADTAWPEAA